MLVRLAFLVLSRRIVSCLHYLSPTARSTDDLLGVLALTICRVHVYFYRFSASLPYLGVLPQPVALAVYLLGPSYLTLYYILLSIRLVLLVLLDRPSPSSTPSYPSSRSFLVNEPSLSATLESLRERRS